MNKRDEKESDRERCSARDALEGSNIGATVGMGWQRCKGCNYLDGM